MKMGVENRIRAAKPKRDTCKTHASPVPSTVLVIGVGNPFCGDDSAGRIVARRVKRRNRPFLRVVESSGDGTSLMELWAGARAVIVVDAVASERKPGMVHRFDVSHEALPVKCNARSTHAFGLGEAVELARALNQLPHHLIVFGIEGKRFDAGSDLSTGVKKILPQVVDRVLEEGRRLLIAQTSATAGKPRARSNELAGNAAG
jgi:hydrogenase maturation protease